MQYFLFDFDGTLINSAPGLIRSIQDVAAKNGLPAKTDREILPHLGLSNFRAFHDLYGVRGREEARLHDQMRKRYSELSDLQRPFEGVPAWLQELKDDGATLIVCSVRPPYDSAPHLEQMGLLSFFDDVWGNNDGAGRDTKAKVMRYEMEKAHIPPLRTVMIGDKDFDCLAAKANGVFMLGCAYGFGSVEELHRYKADVIVDHVTQGRQVTRLMRRNQTC